MDEYNYKIGIHMTVAFYSGFFAIVFGLMAGHPLGQGWLSWIASCGLLLLFVLIVFYCLFYLAKAMVGGEHLFTNPLFFMDDCYGKVRAESQWRLACLVFAFVYTVFFAHLLLTIIIGSAFDSPIALRFNTFYVVFVGLICLLKLKKVFFYICRYVLQVLPV